MNDSEFQGQPQTALDIARETEAMSFGMMSEAKVGALLATVAASKPGGRLPELGTGTGHGTAWLLAGMDSTAVLDTVDSVIAVARRHLEADARVRFHLMDGASFLEGAQPEQFDLILRMRGQGSSAILTKR